MSSSSDENPNTDRTLLVVIIVTIVLGSPGVLYFTALILLSLPRTIGTFKSPVGKYEIAVSRQEERILGATGVVNTRLAIGNAGFWKRDQVNILSGSEDPRIFWRSDTSVLVDYDCFQDEYPEPGIRKWKDVSIEYHETKHSGHRWEAGKKHRR